MQQLAIASDGRGADLSAAIANLAPFAEDANRLLRVLDTQQGAVQQLVRNTGEVFGALSERQGQLAGLIRNSGIVFHTTAVRNQDLEATFRALPTFLDESRLTLNRLASFSRNANPVITQLHPSARALSADLKPIGKVTPDFKGFFVGLRKTEKRGVTGLPALQQLLNSDLPPLLTELHPFTQQLTPIISGIGRYQNDITGLIANFAVATNAVGTTESGGAGHYIRSSAPSYPESFANFTSHRLAYSRTNPYIAPDSALKVANGLDTFDTRPCASPPRPGRHARTRRQLYRQPVLLEPGDLRHPAAAPRHAQAVPVRRPDDHLGAARAGLHEAAAAALDRPDPRDERLHARLRESLTPDPGPNGGLPTNRVTSFHAENPHNYAQFPVLGSAREGKSKGWRPSDSVAVREIAQRKGVVCVSASI